MSVSVTLHSPFRLFSTRSCTDNWLLAHLRTHDWYLRSGHALWFCKKMSASCKDGTHTRMCSILTRRRHFLQDTDKMSVSCKDGTHTPFQLILASIPRTLLLQRHTGTVLTQCNISVSNSSSNLHSHIFYNVPVSGLVAGRAVGHRRHPSLSTLSHTDRGQ